MGFWEARVVPRIVEAALSTAEVMAYRADVCRPLEGRVIEVGFGSGLNIDHYPAAVESVSAVEPSDTAWQMSAHRRDGSATPIERTGLDGQSLEADNDSFDSALVTFSLCTIPDVDAALTELVRVLRPGGVLAFVEHGLSPDEGVARWQYRLDPIERRVAGGCNLSRDIPALITAAGFKITDLEAGYMDGPAVARPWNYAFRGAAIAP